MAPPANGDSAKSTVSIEIHTDSWSVPNATWMEIRPPVLKMNGKPFPKPKDGPAKAHGYWVIATDAAMDMTDPASILLNEYFYLPRVDETWQRHYESMYRSMMHALLGAGDPERRRVFIISFGMPADAPPPVAVYRYFMNLGAGKELQRWETTRAPVRHDERYYIEWPGCYILLGSGSLGYGQAFELYSDELAYRHEELGYDSRKLARVYVDPTLQNPIAAPHQPHPAQPQPVH
jgi:hypothetical protein